MTVRRSFARYLRGDGVELGAHSAPLDVSGVQTIERLRYVDRYTVAESRQLFPELHDQDIVETDVLCDMIEGLQPFSDGSLDFVIACHLIEHMPDPIFFLEELWRVLSPGGRLYLAAPDMRYLAFDMHRTVTTLDHLIDDHRRRVRIVEDHHLEEFLRLAEGMTIPSDANERQRLFDEHRKRSIHIHDWNTKTFSQFLLYCIREHCPFRVVDLSTPRQNERGEMIFMLEKLERLPLTELLHPQMVRLLALAQDESGAQPI
jgi:predicted SAM-dependent methyltransferase